MKKLNQIKMIMMTQKPLKIDQAKIKKKLNMNLFLSNKKDS